MAQKTPTNVYFYLIIMFFLSIFVAGIQVYSISVLYNDNINTSLTIDEVDYLLSLNNIDLSDFNSTNASQLESKLEANPTTQQTNQTGSQAKDFALEFFYSQSIANRIWTSIGNIINLPSFLATLLAIPIQYISWVLPILNTFWYIMILIAIYYLIRGVVT